jgi:hypothetical protein
MTDLNLGAIEYYANEIGALPSRLETFLRAMNERATDLDGTNFQREATRLADHPCVVIFCASFDTGQFYLSPIAMNASLAAFLRGEPIPMPDFVALATPDVRTAVTFEATLQRRTSSVH